MASGVGVQGFRKVIIGEEVGIIISRDIIISRYKHIYRKNAGIYFFPNSS